ncbi:MAG TPA: hypothetical protein VGQ39_19455 [Pyrinomonadaceae bacterium]|jgi:hypothetical protein|nr:hypothetical protein [Pyrinomonadaceae bacterium]
MQRKKRVSLPIAALFVLALAATLTLIGAQNDQSSKKDDDATPIKEGVLTEKQKAHSKLFKRYEVVTRGRKLRDLVAESGDVDVVKELGDVLVPQAFNLQDYLKNLTCKADAVVVATVQTKSSQIIEEGTFVFTDYQVVVDEVLKSSSTPINPTQNITVTRVGGAVILNGHHVRATDHRQENLAVGGRYLLYLRFIPATSSFQAFANTASEDTFQLIGPKIKQTSAKALPLGQGESADLDTFMILARTATQSPCTN